MQLDCLTCGACCRSGKDGRILVPESDIVRWQRSGKSHLVKQLQPGHFGEMAFATKTDGSCMHLGTQSCVNACRIYEDRGSTCRDFEVGGWQCLEFRRDFRIDA